MILCLRADWFWRVLLVIAVLVLLTLLLLGVVCVVFVLIYFRSVSAGLWFGLCVFFVVR